MALGSPAAAFAVDAASFAVSAATRMAMRAPRAAAPAGGGGQRPREDAGPGLRALLRAERVLLVLVCVNLAANLGSAGLDGVALPALAHGPLHASAQGYGAILAGFAGGALLGTLAAGQARRPRRPAVTGSLAFLAESAAIAVTPFLGSVAAVVAAQAVLGACNGFGNTFTITAFQRWAPRGSLGRLDGLLLVTSFGVAPVSVAARRVVRARARPGVVLPVRGGHHRRRHRRRPHPALVARLRRRRGARGRGRAGGCAGRRGP